jgi:hypothetical protein
LLALSAMARETPSGRSTAAVGLERSAAWPGTTSAKPVAPATLPASSTARPVAGLSSLTLLPVSSTTTSMPEGSSARPTGALKLQALPWQLLAVRAKEDPLPATVETCRVETITLRMRWLALSATYSTEPVGVTATQ